ncbi:MAG: hypothetical protein ACI3XI_01120 [Eubacteriales bacterium]
MKNKTPFREKIWAFMQGRNGVDELYNFSVLVSFVLLIASLFLGGVAKLIISAIYLTLIIWSFWRCFSKNLYKRRKENADFLRMTKKFTAFFRLQRDRFRDRKTHVYRRCKNCKAVLRLPKKPGEHSVCCPQCSHRFKVYIAGMAKKNDDDKK